MDSILFFHSSVGGLWAVYFWTHWCLWEDRNHLLRYVSAQEDADKVPYSTVQCLAAVGSARPGTSAVLILHCATQVSSIFSEVNF